MRSTMFRLVATFVLTTFATAAEPIPPGVSITPTTPTVVATNAAELALHQYFYIDFPRQLQALQYKRQLAEAEIALIARRLETYRPSRSFGRYGATYTADLATQIDLLAAQHVLTCFRDEEVDLWRERRLILSGQSCPALLAFGKGRGETGGQ